MDLEERIGRLLREKRLSLAVAESCTGGLICHRLTNVSGSSAYLERGVVVYGNQAKIDLLGIPENVLAESGAVSARTAELMARGIRERSGVDLGLAVTGIAGPTGGSPAKPVGTVFIALAWAGGVHVEHALFPGDRLAVKHGAAERTLAFLEEHLTGRLPLN